LRLLHEKRLDPSVLKFTLGADGGPRHATTRCLGPQRRPERNEGVPPHQCPRPPPIPPVLVAISPTAFQRQWRFFADDAGATLQFGSNLGPTTLPSVRLDALSVCSIAIPTIHGRAKTVRCQTRHGPPRAIPSLQPPMAGGGRGPCPCDEVSLETVRHPPS